MAEERDRGGRTALHYACGREGGGVEEVRSLLAEGYDIDAADKKGFTPLFFAAEGAQPEVTQVLIEAGANVNAQDQFGTSALGRAMLVPGSEAKQVVRALLAGGADPDQKNNYDRSPRDVVNDIVNEELKGMFSQYPAKS